MPFSGIDSMKLQIKIQLWDKVSCLLTLEKKSSGQDETGFTFSSKGHINLKLLHVQRQNGSFGNKIKNLYGTQRNSPLKITRLKGSGVQTEPENLDFYHG